MLAHGLREPGRPPGHCMEPVAWVGRWKFRRAGRRCGRASGTPTSCRGLGVSASPSHNRCLVPRKPSIQRTESRTLGAARPRGIQTISEMLTGALVPVTPPEYEASLSTEMGRVIGPQPPCCSEASGRTAIQPQMVGVAVKTHYPPTKW